MTEYRALVGFPGDSGGKNWPADTGDLVRSLSQEDPLQRNGNRSRIFIRGTPCTEEPGGSQPMGLQSVRHDWATNKQKPKKCIRV